MASENGAKPYKTNAIDELTNAFDLLDLEGNDDLEFPEFKLGLRSLRLDISHEEAIQLFESIDHEKEGRIDRTMFMEWLEKDINSSVIEDLRTRIRAAISSQSNAADEEDDVEQEMKIIERKQSILHPELADTQSDQGTVIERLSDVDEDYEYNDGSNSQSSDSASDSADSNSKSKSKSKSSKSNQQHQHNRTRTKSNSKSKNSKQRAPKLQNSSSKRSHRKHASSRSSNHSMQRIIENDGGSGSDDTTNAYLDQKRKKSASKTVDTTMAVAAMSPQMDPHDMDPAMLAQYEKLQELKQQHMRSLTRDLESRHTINQTNADKFSVHDINDITNEMLNEMTRLRRQSTLESNKSNKSNKKTHNSHMNNFSDASLDSMRGPLGAPLGPLATLANRVSDASEPPRAPQGRLVTTHEDDELDATLINTIDVSLSHKNSQHSQHNPLQPNPSNPTPSGPDAEDEINYNNNKKTSLTLSNPVLDVQQTGNIDENAADIEYTDRLSKTSKGPSDPLETTPGMHGTHGMHGMGRMSNTASEGGMDPNHNRNGAVGKEEDDVLKELKHGNLRSDTIKGRAGSLRHNFEQRGQFGLDPNDPNMLSTIGVVGNGSNLSVGSAGGAATFFRDNTNKSRALSDTLHSFVEAQNTTRAVSQSIDRMYSDHTVHPNNMGNMGNVANVGNYGRSAGQPIPGQNGGVAAQRKGMAPVIGSGSFGMNHKFIPSLPSPGAPNIQNIGNSGNRRNMGSMANMQGQAVMITNTPGPSYQPPIPMGSNATPQTNVAVRSNGSVVNNFDLQDPYHSRRSDSRHSISLSHHSSVGSNHSGMGINPITGIASGGMNQMSGMNGMNAIGGMGMNGMNGMNQMGGMPAYRMVDIADFTGGTAGNEVEQSLIGSTNNMQQKAWILRLINWYFEPIHTKSTFKSLLYHGANLVFSCVCCVVTLILLIVSTPTLITCCLGVLGFSALFECCRVFANFDMLLGRYFFDTHVIPRFAVFIPTIHDGDLTTKLRDYSTDPHMLQIMFYLMFLKFPSSVLFSGISLVLFAGVTSVLMTPLVYWFDSDYFNAGKFCVFGSYDSSANDPCSGWSVDSFGDTIGAFLMFLPLMPLTLHLCKYTAKLLFRISCNFMTMDVKYKEKKRRDKSGYAPMHMQKL